MVFDLSTYTVPLIQLGFRAFFTYLKHKTEILKRRIVLVWMEIYHHLPDSVNNIKLTSVQRINLVYSRQRRSAPVQIQICLNLFMHLISTYFNFERSVGYNNDMCINHYLLKPRIQLAIKNIPIPLNLSQSKHNLKKCVTTAYNIEVSFD